LSAPSTHRVSCICNSRVSHNTHTTEVKACIPCPLRCEVVVERHAPLQSNFDTLSRLTISS
jgi:hypothetical protein